MDKDTVIFIGMIALFSGLAIYEGYYIDASFYSMAAVIWIMCVYFILAFGRSKVPQPPG
ncbi:MAG TPA: hypothetical protein VGQ13_04335 [Nitrososphaera sp.]|nr:hypothetical protein [Nitrososphaera sp.]